MASDQRINTPLSEVRAADQESARYGDDYAEKEKNTPAPAPGWLRQSTTRPHESEFARRKPRDREHWRSDFTDRELADFAFSTICWRVGNQSPV